VTGNDMRNGTGAYPLRGHNNVQGCSDFGSMPNYFPGYELVEDEEVGTRYEKAWDVTLRPENGKDNHEMIGAIYEDELNALYIIVEESGIFDAHSNYVQGAVKRLDLLGVQDLFFTTTAKYADVVLPAVPSLEKDGTFTNTERRIQRLYQALDPVGEAKPDWLILTELAAKMDHEWGYTHPSDIMDEAAALTPSFAGVSYDRLEGYDSLQWPVDKDGTDSPLLYVEGFPFPD